MIVAAALVAAACRQADRAGEPIVPAPAPPPYPAALAPWPPAPPAAVIGRGVAPAPAVPVPVTAPWPWPPPRVDRVWQVPADGDDPDGAALAAVSGMVGDRQVVDLVDVDAGVVRWRSGRCHGPVVHVTADRVLCGNAREVVALDVAAGAVAWRHPLRFAAAGDALIVAAAPDDGADAPDPRVHVIDVRGGDVAAVVELPEGVPPGWIRAACRWGAAGAIELWLGGPALGRIELAPGAAGPAEVAWLPVGGAPARVDACGALDALVEVATPDRADRAIHVVARAPLAITGGPVAARAAWRDGRRIVLATADGLERRDAGLAFVERLSDAPLGREVARHGRRRLVRGPGGALVLIEDERPVAALAAPLHADSAALGRRHVLGGPWRPPARTLADAARRWRLPDTVVRAAGAGGSPADRDAAAATLPARPAPAPLHPPPVAADLPPELPGDAAPITLPGAGAHGVGLAAVDPYDPATVLAMPFEDRPDPTRGAGLAALDLRARAWRWHAPDGCPPGMPVALAVARDVIACGARASEPGGGAVRAVTRRGGATLWTWRGVTVDAVAAAGGIVVVTVGRRAEVLDAATGARLGEVAADDGYVPRVAAVTIGGADAVVTAERGGVVARLPRAGMLPAWAAGVRGTVEAIAVAAGRVMVQLDDGELYLLDAATGDAVAAGGWARRWRPVGGGDLVLAEPAIPEGPAWIVWGHGADGGPRFAIELAVEPPWLVGARAHAPGAPLALAYGPAARALAVIDAATGVVRARFTLPDRAVPGAVFATEIDGVPVAGALLARPLAAVLF